MPHKGPIRVKIDGPVTDKAKPKHPDVSIPKGPMESMHTMQGDVGAYRTAVTRHKGTRGFKGGKPVHASEYFPVRPQRTT